MFFKQSTHAWLCFHEAEVIASNDLSQEIFSINVDSFKTLFGIWLQALLETLWRPGLRLIAILATAHSVMRSFFAYSLTECPYTFAPPICLSS